MQRAATSGFGLMAVSLLMLSIGCSVHHNAQGPVHPWGTPMDWGGRLGQVVSVEGTVEQRKVGPYLQCAGGGIWVDDTTFGSRDLAGRRIMVTGTVAERYDLPVFIQREGDPPVTGIPVPEGTDLHEASRRYVLTKATYRLLD